MAVRCRTPDATRSPKPRRGEEFRPSCVRRFGKAGRRLFAKSRVGSRHVLEGTAMADDKTKTGRADRDRINVNEPYELRDWSKALGVSEDVLKAAVRKAGPMAKDVAKALGRP